MVVHPPNRLSRPKRHRGFARTAVMAVSSLVLVLALYVIYQRTSARDGILASPAPTAASNSPNDSDREKPPIDADNVPIDLTAAALRDGPALKGPQDVKGRGGSEGAVDYYDERGRKWLSVRFRTWRPVEGADNEVEIDEPVIRFRTPRGQLIKAEAKHGHLSLRTLSSRTQEPQSGSLTGDVRITVDRLSDAQRELLPEDQRDNLDDARRIDIEMESIVFDMELSRVTSPGAFRIKSIEADIRGSGLSLRFNELESRIETLIVSEGESIELWGVGDQFNIDLENVDEGGAEVEQAAADEQPEAVETDIVAAADDGSVVDGDAPTDVMDIDSDGVPILRPQEPVKNRIRPTDTYTAVFEDDVRVTRFTKELIAGRLAADRLELLFDFGDRQRDLARRNPHASPKGDDDQGEPISSDDDRVLLTWHGKLTLESVRTEKTQEQIDAEALSPESYKPQRMQVTATGTPVELSDPTRRVICKKLIYSDDSGVATLEGDASMPAVVASQGMGKLAAMTISLDRENGTASAAGPGRLETLAAPGGRGLGDQPLELDFSRRLDATFEPVEVSKFDPQTGRSYKSNRQTLKHAEFDGDVKMRHGAENVTCGRIGIDFERDANGDVFPTAADAYDDVVAYSQDRYIQAADRMLLDMESIEEPRPPFDMARARAEAIRRNQDPDALDWDAIRANYESKRTYRAGLKRLQAFGDVEVRDPRQAFEVSSRELDCSFRDGKQIERGLITPREKGGSYIRFGDFSIATPQRIPFDVIAQKVEIDGPGRMTFPATQDLDGGKLKEPEIVRVSWARSMRFAGDDNKASFDGDVRAKTDTSDFEAPKLDITFRDVEPEQPQAAKPQRDWWIFEPLINRQPSESLPPIDLASDRKRKEPTYVYATGGVKVVTRQYHKGDDQIATRMLIVAPTLVIDPIQELMSAEGAGSLLIEDYKSPTAGASSGGAVVTPFGKQLSNESSQTYVSWAASMVYHYRNNQARFDRDVQVSHRTGGKMKLVDALRRDGGPVPPRDQGREASLRCDAMEIRFMRDSAKDQAGASRLSGNEVDSFMARGDVAFEDSGISAIAHTILYHRVDGILQIMGSDTQDAQLFDQRKRFTALKGPKFIWDRNTNQINLEQSTAHIR